MILDFAPWRAELCNKLDELDRAIDEYRMLCAVDAQKVDVSIVLAAQDRNNFELEKILFYSAVICRKMIEAAHWANTTESVLEGQPIRYLPEGLLEKAWGLTDQTGQSHSRSAMQILDEIIHSKEISWAEQPYEGAFEGFWLASDRWSDRGPLFIFWHEFKDLVALFASAPANTISSN
jgi:hypothetical protein